MWEEHGEARRRARFQTALAGFFVLLLVASMVALTLWATNAGGNEENQDGEPNYSSPANLAISISWPLYKDGTRADSRSYTGVRRYDAESDAVLPAYRQARELAVKRQVWDDDPRGLLSNDELFGRCSAFVATIVIDTITPVFTQSTLRMYPWISDPANGWTLVGDTEHYDPDSYEPGDIFLTDVIADAALGNKAGTTTRVGALRRSIIDPKTGTDSKGRHYDVWRYAADPAQAEAKAVDRGPTGGRAAFTALRWNAPLS